MLGQDSGVGHVEREVKDQARVLIDIKQIVWYKFSIPFIILLDLLTLDLIAIIETDIFQR